MKVCQNPSFISTNKTREITDIMTGKWSLDSTFNLSNVPFDRTKNLP